MTYKEFPYPDDYPWIHARGCQFHKQPFMRNSVESLGKVLLSHLYWPPRPNSPLCRGIPWWLSQQYSGLNPCCPSYNQSFLSQTCLRYPAITCSSNLQTTEVKCPQSHVPIHNADCSVCTVTKMCPPFWFISIKLLMAHLLIVVTLIAVFLLSVCYRLPKQKHKCVDAALYNVSQHSTTSTSIMVSCYNIQCTIWSTVHIVYQRISSSSAYGRPIYWATFWYSLLYSLMIEQ